MRFAVLKNSPVPALYEVLELVNVSSFLVMMSYLLMSSNILAFSDLTGESNSELKDASSHVGGLPCPTCI